MNLDKSIINIKKVPNNQSWNTIEQFFKNNKAPTLSQLINLVRSFNIDITNDSFIIQKYLMDWANNKGTAIGLCRPKSSIECGIIVRCFYKYRMKYTICAGQTALTGSSCPSGGFVISLEKMTKPSAKLELVKETIDVPVGIYLEHLRNQVEEQSNGKLIYPVDPTSRNEAMVGGTLSCNASGFTPGDEGATRHWVNGIDFILPNGYGFYAERGQYISFNSTFSFKSDKKLTTFKIPTYIRPKIKNASGPYSSNGGNVDIVDCIIGSEGIYGIITRCKLRTKKKPKGHLDLFIRLQSESEALDFYSHLKIYLDGSFNRLTALEYFGFNCQKYMKHKDHFFNKEDQVGIYIQVVIKKNFDETCIEWLRVIDRFKINIADESIFVLNDKNQWNIFFEARHSIPVNALEKSRELKGTGIITDAIVPPQNFSKFLKGTHKLLANSEIEYLLFGHLGDCHLHFHLIPTLEQNSISKIVYKNIVSLSSSLGGVYSAEHGTGKRKRMDFLECYGQDAVDEVVESKKSIDPYGLINIGNVISSILN